MNWKLEPKKEQNIRFLETLLTLFGTGPHYKTCGVPQRTPLWPGLQSSWSLQPEVPYIIWDTPVGLKVKVITLVILAAGLFGLKQTGFCKSFFLLKYQTRTCMLR